MIRKYGRYVIRIYHIGPIRIYLASLGWKKVSFNISLDWGW